MKKSMIKLTAILLLGLGMLSCEKEDVQPTNSSSSILSVTDKANGSSRVWHDNGGPADGEDYGCWDSGGNCRDEVVVKPSSFVIFEDLNDASNNGDLIEVKRIISENFNYLSDYINSDDLDLVLENSLILKTRGVVNEGSRLYVLFQNGESIISVYPMNF